MLRRHARLARWLVSSLLLLWLAAPYWPGTVDDVYITVGFARTWAETGSLTWTDGVRVEGYSNFLLVALLAAFVRAGADGVVAAQLLSLASAVGILGLLSWKLPRSALGTTALLAAAIWTPLCRWSVVGMETTLYALLLAAGWMATITGIRSFGVGVVLLALASITRPEGAAYIGIAFLLRATMTRRWTSQDTLAAAAIGALVGYHAIRVWWFGALVPTPVLVKIGGQPWTWTGIPQVSADLLLAVGVLAATWAATRPSWRVALLAAVPLALQSAVIVRAGGDWMVHARLVLPGVVATVISVAATSTAKAPLPLASRSALVLLCAGAALFGGTFESKGWKYFELDKRSQWGLAHPHQIYRSGLGTPFADDLWWMVENIPPGSTVWLTDIGMLSAVGDLTIIDLGGLVSRDVAERRATDQVLPWMLARLSTLEGESYLRVSGVQHDWFALPDEQADIFSPCARTPAGATFTQWFCTTAASTDSSLRQARWDSLMERFPTQPELIWMAARSAARASDLHRAKHVLASGREKWPDDPRFDESMWSISFVSGDIGLKFEPDRGFSLYQNGHLLSRELAGAPLSLCLDVDSPGEEGALARVVSLPCEVTHVITVKEETCLPALRFSCPEAPEFRVELHFDNDRQGEAGDSNLYAYIIETQVIAGE